MTKIITPHKNRISVDVPQEYIGLPVEITMVLVGNRQIQSKEMSEETAEIDTDYTQSKEIAGNVAPEGYMTHKEFWHEADKRIINICKQYGVLQ